MYACGVRGFERCPITSNPAWVRASTILFIGHRYAAAIGWFEPFHRVSEACEVTGPTPGTRADIENGAIDCRGPRLDDRTVRVIR